ncbi:Flp pilus assembly protein CpaB [Pendulispora albinea]|uniref:Flp pilus assembly protein CpaB n=1 Tax=Pendulispora albinea TaxID=2741071 RepID=A0ABZ2LM31_9BACT
MKRTALFFAIISTVIGIFCLAFYQRRFEMTQSGGDKVKLLAAAKLIERGTVITDEMIVVHEVPMAYVEDRAIKEAERAKIIGMHCSNRVMEGETFMWSDLSASEEKRSLSAAIQPGSRAVTIRTSREDSNAPLIRPGDYVDVVAVVKDGRIESDNMPGKSSVVLIQRAQVLASGLNVSTAEGLDPSSVAYINDKAESTLLTLSLTLQEAQILALAGEKGNLSVVLRAPGDQRTLAVVPEIASNELYDPKLRAQRSSMRETPRPGAAK